MKLLTIKELEIIYKHHYLFEQLSLSVEKGERLIILGESGSGKSSILKAVLGAIDYEGTIELNCDISYMPQDLALFDHKTVRQNVEAPATINKQLEKPDDNEYAKFGLDKHLDIYVSKLSGGERQRVALMRALHSGGELLLFDEPLSKLDEINKKRMLEYFKLLIDDKFGLIYITHDVDEAIVLGTKILVLSDIPQVIDNNLDADIMRRTLSKMLHLKGE